ncbi:MAG: TRAP transporter large permease [Bacillota bacterium]
MAILGNVTLTIFILFFFLLIMKVPIAITLGVAALYGVYASGLSFSMMSYNFYGAIASFPLLAIPFFVMAGVIMEKARLAEKIVNFIKILVGPIHGGLAIAAVIVAIFWGALSGSGPATVAALGIILIPGMVKAEYDKGFATAVVSVSSGLAIIIPPSIAFIVYGMVANVSIGTLFIAGIIPGVIVGLALCIIVYFISKKRGYKGEEWVSLKEVWFAFKDAFWAFLTPIIILGGIYGGIFTPTEAAAVAVFYGIFVGMFVYKTVDLPLLFKIGTDSANTTAVVMLVLGCASLFTWVGTNLGFIRRASDLLMGISESELIILFFINVIVLISGMILDPVSIYYVYVPILLPIIYQMGWNPVWFGVIMTVNLAIGQVTPPVAVNLYVGSNISGISLERLSKEALPLIGAVLIALTLLVLFPVITTFLPKVLGIM